MVREYQMLKERGIFELTLQPMEKNVIGSKWVFAIKQKNDGTVDKRKAWTVAKGFTQVLGEDYDETYVSVACLDSIWLICAIAVSQGLRLWQVDFVSAFLNSDSLFDIYMEQSKGFEKGGDNCIQKLQKILYGTIQGTYNWTKNLDQAFEDHGYLRL